MQLAMPHDRETSVAVFGVKVQRTYGLLRPVGIRHLFPMMMHMLSMDNQ